MPAKVRLVLGSLDGPHPHQGQHPLLCLLEVTQTKKGDFLRPSLCGLGSECHLQI